MRKICFSLIFLISPFLVYAQNIPQPSGWVNDFAGVISPEYKEKLNSLIEELEQKTTAEIAVVTINSIAPYDEKEYARLLFDNWKPGKKGKDNGVLVLLAVKERRWRIETGYGVEGVLPDGLCGEIGRNYMVPYFKEGKYSEGLYNGVIAISNVISKDIVHSINNTRNARLENENIFVGIFVVSLLSFCIGFFPFIIGIPLFVIVVIGSFTVSILTGFFVICVYIFSLKVRHSYWRKLPHRKRGKFFDWIGGGYIDGSWGGGGFGGGGGGGGGFGGGGGGGGGAGGGF